MSCGIHVPFALVRLRFPSVFGCTLALCFILSLQEHCVAHCAGSPSCISSFFVTPFQTPLWPHMKYLPSLSVFCCCCICCLVWLGFCLLLLYPSLSLHTFSLSFFNASLLPCFLPGLFLNSIVHLFFSSIFLPFFPSCSLPVCLVS